MKKALVVLVALLFVASAAYAECACCKNVKSDEIGKAWGGRICSGLCNGLLGWSEIFFRPGKVMAEGGNAFVGFFRGLGNAVERTCGGALELVTFWTPGKSAVVMEDCPLCTYK